MVIMWPAHARGLPQCSIPALELQVCPKMLSDWSPRGTTLASSSDDSSSLAYLAAATDRGQWAALAPLCAGHASQHDPHAVPVGKWLPLAGLPSPPQ